MKRNIFNKYICCTLDLTIATRLIALIGITISVLLVTALLNDKFSNNYNISRNIALALGLDWRHIHPDANVSPHVDPEGKNLTIILIFYALAFFVLNSALMIGAIWYDARWAVPWLLCEIVGCVSKFGALIFHLLTERNNLSNVFLIGSVIYIFLIIWWWLVVFSAQHQWIFEKYNDAIIPTHQSQDQLSLSNISYVPTTAYPII